MAAVRRIVSTSPLIDGRIVLDARAAHYAGHVLRLVDGVTVDVLDASGEVARGTLRFGRDEVVVEGAERLRSESSGSGVVLYAALIKAARFEWLVEKAAELGVEAIVPMVTARTVIRPEDGRVEKKLERWQRIADEAVRQCEGPRRVTVRAPASFGQAVAEGGASGIFADETARNGAWDAVDEGRGSLFVGPEGGFSDEERAALRASGALAVGLGPRLLRGETAAVAALAILGATRWGLVGRG